MSSGYFSPDGKCLTFEVNSQSTVAQITIVHLDGDDNNPDKIFIKMRTDSGTSHTSTSNSCSVSIDKSNTKVMSHFFKEVAKVMDEWYKEK